MIETLIMLSIGLTIGFLFKKFHTEKLKWKLNSLLSVVVIVLLFVMGLTLGSNDEIIYNFTILGYNSIVLALLIFFGSILFGYIFKRGLF